MKFTENMTDEKGWIFIPAFMMIGMGVGYIIGNVAIGLFMGMGVGFLTKGIISIFLNNKNSK